MLIGRKKQRVALSAFAVVLGAVLVLGETYRSFGQGRPFFNWFDDYIVGFFLFLGAYKTFQSARKVKFLSAAFAICATGTAMSYFSKILNPDQAIHSNVSFSILTNLLLIVFVTSSAGMFWTLAVDFQDDEGLDTQD